MILMSTDKSICPSCGSPKLTEDGQPAPHYDVCFYCYLRGTISNLKLFILIVLSENTKPVTLYELAELMTAHHINKGRREFTKNTIYGAVRLMVRPNNKLILVGHRKSKGKGGVGRKLNTYRIGRRKGIRYMQKYLDRWDYGKVIHLKQKKAKGIMRTIRRSENRVKPISIRNKIEDEEYDRFKFFMIRDYEKSNEQ